MSISYVVTVSDGNDLDNNIVVEAGKGFKQASSTFKIVQHRYASRENGPYTITLVRVDQEAKTVKVLDELSVGKVAAKSA